MRRQVNELIERYATVEQVRREYVAPDIFDYHGELRAFIESDGASNSGSAGASGDGVGYGLKLHHKSLGRLFEVTCLHIPLSDRTDFQGLLSLVEAEVLQEHIQSPSRPLFLVGESFGALLAAAVAARNPSLPLSLVLINSATSFPRSSLQPLIPLLKSVPPEAYSALPFLFSLAIVNPIRIASGGLPLEASPLTRLEKLRDNLLSLLPSLPGQSARPAAIPPCKHAASACKPLPLSADLSPIDNSPLEASPLDRLEKLRDNLLSLLLSLPVSLPLMLLLPLPSP
ncbi:unnamed protein product [Closterium sp. Naga37s-1]|nr:unnamed protein product [Closterium sp. Naga37s-1]